MPATRYIHPSLDIRAILPGVRHSDLTLPGRGMLHAVRVLGFIHGEIRTGTLGGLIKSMHL